MAITLGIYVSTDDHLDKVIELCRAAREKQVEVTLFFTHLGTTLTQAPEFAELEGLANLAVCNVGFEANDLKKPVPGLDDKDYATQTRHGEMIEELDRYMCL